MSYESLFAETIYLRGHNGDTIDAYFARPLGAGPCPGVVVIHHMPGWDEAHKEIGRRFAHYGYATLVPNLQFREGKATPEENSASIRAAGGMPDDRTMGDVQAAIDYVRGLPYLNDKVGVIGYCSGGRQAYLAGCTLRGIDAVIACYGGGVAAKPDELTPRQPAAPIDFTQDLQCPLLGFFGSEDTRPSPADAAKTEEALKRCGKTYEFHTYENTGHAFFAVDRPQYRVHAAVDGWKKVLAWFGKYLNT
ncbi:MAG: dienelactone hydrolase family protein [Betaproteobacteria bacterium]